MAQAIIIKRIARRTGVKGVPRTTRDEGIRRIEPDENPRAVAKMVLAVVKKRTKRDGNDRQIEWVEVKRLKSGRHKITERVLYRVYRSRSDKKVYVYRGEAHRGPRDEE